MAPKRTPFSMRRKNEKFVKGKTLLFTIPHLNLDETMASAN
jgi:hypothetical protein